MTIEEFKHVIKSIKPYTNYVYLHVKGEPLLHKDFKKIINTCEENDIFINLTTNATFLNKYKSSFL